MKINPSIAEIRKLKSAKQKAEQDFDTNFSWFYGNISPLDFQSDEFWKYIKWNQLWRYQMSQTNDKENGPWGIVIFFLSYVFSVGMNIWWGYYAGRLRSDLENYKQRYEYVQSYLKTDTLENQEFVSLDGGRNWFIGKMVKTLPGWSDLRPASPDLVAKLKIHNKLLEHVKSIEDVKVVQDLLKSKGE